MGSFRVALISSQVLFSLAIAEEQVMEIASERAVSRVSISTSDSETRQLQRIYFLWGQADYENAKIEMASYFERYPNSLELDAIHAMLGDFFFEQGLYESAFEEYESIQQEGLQKEVLAAYVHCVFEMNDMMLLDELTKGEERFLPYYGFVLTERIVAAKDRDLQHALMKEAKPIYEKLVMSSFSTHVCHLLLEIAKEEKNWADAEKYALYLADKSPERDPFLFLAGLLKSQENLSLAAETFSWVTGFDAKYNQILSLYAAKNYAEILQVQGAPEDPLISAIVGMSYFSLEKFDEALALLEPLLDSDLSQAVLHELSEIAILRGDEALFQKVCQKLSSEEELLLKKYRVSTLLQKKAFQVAAKLSIEDPLFAQELQVALAQIDASDPCFAELAQQAVSKHPEWEITPTLHVRLFNCYLDKCPEKAKENLYAAIESGKISIKTENLLWLAHALETAGDGTRARVVYSALMQQKNTDPKLRAAIEEGLR